MNAFFNWLLEVNVALLVWFAAYGLFLNNENQFAFKRFFLLGGIGISFLTPLLHLTFAWTERLAPALGGAIPTYWLPEAGISLNGDSGPSVTSDTMFIMTGQGIYFSMTVIFAGMFLFRIFKIIRMILQSRKYRWQNCFVAESESEKPIFSFFNFIFIGQASQLDPGEKERILRHELVHVQRKHSFDILIINLTAVLCWFNPVLILYRRAFVQIHEFEADGVAVAHQDVDQYCLLMAKVALSQSGFPLANHFHTSLTTKRITMMKTIKRKIQYWKFAMLALTLPVMILVVSCQEQVMSDLRFVGANSATAVDIPGEVLAKLSDLKKQSPKNEYIVIELTGDGLKTLEKMKASFAQSGKNYDVILLNTYGKPDGKIDRSFAFLVRGEMAFTLSDLISKDSVYNFAETSPVYPGGFDSLKSYVGKTLKYPAESRKNGVQGKVFVQFIVEKDGTISNPEVVKGIEAACDKEAVRVIAGMKPWTPGIQKGQTVRVKFVIPINFSLG